MYQALYPALGLPFSFFSNPEQLGTIIIETQDLTFDSIRVGDSLQQVREKHGQEGDWHTTGKEDCWWLKLGRVQVGFDRDKTKKRYPMQLVKPEKQQNSEYQC